MFHERCWRGWPSFPREVYNDWDLCYMIITEFDCTQELIDEIGELRAISGHMLGAAGVQIPEDNFDDLHSSIEEDGPLETMDPRD
ncbi:hypothetical protein Tco_0331440 [Tanacetum coccineum]